MIRIFRSTAMLSGLAVLALAGGAANAAQCRDAHGKFIKCATAKAAPATTRCHDAHGKFIKCPAAPAKAH
jgi:hypothetical protein